MTEATMHRRHSPEDLLFLQEHGYEETVEELQRLHKIEDALRMVASKIHPGDDTPGDTFADFSYKETTQIFMALGAKQP